MERAGDEVGEGAEQERLFLGEIHRLESFDVENAVEMVGVENRKAHGGGGIRENGLRATLIVGERAVDCGFPGARHLADEAGVERQTLSKRVTACAAFGLDDEFARGVIEQGDADVVVAEAVFELLGDFGEDFVRIERGDGVAGDEVEQAEMAGLGALILEEARIFNGDAGFAGENAEEFEMPFVVGPIVVGVDAERSNGLVIGDERDSAEGAGSENGFNAQLAGFNREIFTNEDRLASADNVFGEVIPGGTRVHGLALTANHFEIEIDGVADRVRGSNIKIFDVEEAAQLFPNFDEEIFLVESGAEGAANFVEDMEFLGAAGGLLNEVAIFDGHADLVAEGEKEAEFRGSEAAIVGRAEEKEAEGLFLGLETDDDDAAEAVLEGEFAEAAERLVVFK